MRDAIPCGRKCEPDPFNVFASTVAGGFAAGGISGGNLNSALQGAFFAAAFFQVGELSGAHGAGGVGAMSATQRLGQIAGHALVGCAQGAAAGGSCKSGAMSAGFAAAAGPFLPGKDISVERFAAVVSVGALASKFGGGSYENGAMTAAFGYLFNQLAARAGGSAAAAASGAQGSSPSRCDEMCQLGIATAGAVGTQGSSELNSNEKTYVTYTLTGPAGEIYAGRTSGYGLPEGLVNDRFRYHHMRLVGYNSPQVDVSATGEAGYAAIRGREQLIIDINLGISSRWVGNSINGISFLNPLKDFYIMAAQSRFGNVPLPRAKGF